MMISITESQHCTGCRACEQACPKKCIHMVPDKDGFLYPQIQREKCIDCRLCERICPIDKKRFPNLAPQKVYASYLKDTETLAKSASGGMFPALAKLVLKEGGTVYGCAWNSDMKAVQIRITDETELNRMQGSKYVQSDTQNTYQMAEQDLKNGRKVLYTGTPCQIAGFKSFLEKEYGNLLTADLVCHGVPSPMLFQDYITWLNQKLKGRIHCYDFRDKSTAGWGSSGKYDYKKNDTMKSKIMSVLTDPYYYYFSAGCISRECCYTCKYAGSTRVGDFTIGDFWGVERFHPEVSRKQGVSALLVNTDRAFSMMKQLENQLVLIESTLKNVTFQNHQLRHPVNRTPERDILMDVWHKEGFPGINRKYRQASAFQRLKRNVVKMIPAPIKKRIKHLVDFHKM